MDSVFAKHAIVLTLQIQLFKGFYYYIWFEPQEVPEWWKLGRPAKVAKSGIEHLTDIARAYKNKDVNVKM
jgi:hypothetical protein